MVEETNIPDYPRGITFEQVWAGFMEDRKRIEETGRLMKERDERLSRQMAETDRQMKESDERLKQQMAETDRQMKESDERLKQQMAETDRRMKERDEEFTRRMQETDRGLKESKKLIDSIGKQMGDLTNRFGEIAEHLVVPGIAARFNELGYHFGSIVDGNYKILDENGKIKTELDIVLENDESIIVVEVKAKPRIGDVEHHIRRLEIFREFRNKRHRDERKIMGAIAGAIFGKHEKAATIEAGMYVIEQSGETMKIDIPEGFIPTEW